MGSEGAELTTGSRAPGEVPLRLSSTLGPSAPPEPRRRRARRRPRLDPWMTLGVSAACVGALVSLHAPTAASSGLRDGTLVLAGTSLLARPGGTYAGAAAVALRGAPGSWRIAASARLDGRETTGRCTESGSVAHCTFTVRGEPDVACEDRLEGGAWARTYSDGRHTTLPVTGIAVPVPLPFGR